MGLCLAGISISTKRTRSHVALAKLQILPTADACGNHAKPFGGFAAGRTSGNSSEHANSQIDRVRIPVKSAIDSETKPATHSDFIPASIPI
jgi:hypothetical protein